MKKLTLIITVLWLATLLAAPACHNVARAGWTNDPYTGFVTVAGTEFMENQPQVCALAGGRTFIAWQRYDAPQTSWWEYYQVLDQFGNNLLPVNGVKLIDGDWINGGFEVLPDGQGGCIMVLSDKRDGTWDIWGQRVDSLGNRLWGTTGMPLVIWPGPATDPVYARDFNSDSLGNFFLSWFGGVLTRGGIFIQKFNASGATMWGPMGSMVSRYYAYLQDTQESVPDGAGGIIEVFESYISQFGDPQLRVQHLNAVGQPLLPLNGAPLRNLSGQIMYGSLFEGVPDGAGGGIWSAIRLDHIHVWRLNSQGQMQWLWTEHLATSNQGIISMIRHPGDGTVWYSGYYMVGNIEHFNTLRFSLTGTSFFGQGRPYGGYLVPINDGVISVNSYTSTPNGIYASKIDTSGTLQWRSTVAFILGGFPSSTTDASQGAVVAFEIAQTYWNHDICAQRVLANGQLGNPPDESQAPAPGTDSWK